MITNFESITYEMTEIEISVAEFLAKHFNKNHRGKLKAITSVKILKLLTRKSRSWKMTDARLRKIINYIRHTNLCNCLVATSKGYYVSAKKIEVETYIQSLEERAYEIERTKEALVAQYGKRFKTLSKNKKAILKKKKLN